MIARHCALNLGGWPRLLGSLTLGNTVGAPFLRGFCEGAGTTNACSDGATPPVSETKSSFGLLMCDKSHMQQAAPRPPSQKARGRGTHSFGTGREGKAEGRATRPVRALIPLIVALLLSEYALAQKTVSFPTEDGGVVYADVYGEGDRAVVLAHGGQFNKESWEKQARKLVAAGFRVLALDFRGYGKSHGPGDSDPMDAPLHLDVLAAVRYLRTAGAKSVSIVGGSMGGGAAGDASIASRPGEIDRLVLLGAAPNNPADKLKSATLFIVARDDASGDGPRLPWIREQYEKAPQPKELIILEGSAHAQFLFQTDQGDRVMREILRFLTAK